MNDPDNDVEDPSSIHPVEARFTCEAVTRVDRPQPTIASPVGKSATDRSAAPPNAKISGTRLRRALILLAHDHADVGDGFADYLRRTGFRIAQADGGVVTVERARELMPDAILLDYATPATVTDGVLAASWLKREPSTRRIPILLVTASRERAESTLACDAYLEKPCDPRRVADALHSLMQMPGARVGEGR
jgi:CheY-like chemotaxis protein